jgi:tRNA A37 methylthiotransferase MiaB
MHRFYIAKEFTNIVQAFKSAIPGLTLATDVIVGFPGETDRAFENTLNLLKAVKPDVVNVSKFFARPKTAAAQIREGIVEPEEIKRRSAVTAELAKQYSFEQNKRWSGWAGEVLVDEKGKVPGSWVGRNFAYKPIAIKSGGYLLGKTLSVKVTKAYPTYLAGAIVN